MVATHRRAGLQPVVQEPSAEDDAGILRFSCGLVVYFLLAASTMLLLLYFFYKACPPPASGGPPAPVRPSAPLVLCLFLHWARFCSIWCSC
jgi:hypothetical protein